MRNLIKFLLNNGSVKDNKVDNPFIAYESTELLKRFSNLISEIRGCTALSDMDWETTYVELIRNVAKFTQNLPASAANHDNEIGGLLKHSLEIAMYAARVTRGRRFTPTGEEIDVARLSQAFVFTVTTAALLHDLGKLITDLEVYYFPDKTSQEPIRWNPISGPIPVGCKYSFKMNRGMNRSKDDHAHASALLVSQIVPEKGIRWITQLDDNLFRLWVSTVSGHGKDFGGDVYDCIHKADIACAKKSMQSGAGMSNSAFETQNNSNAIGKESNALRANGAGERYFHEPFIKYWSELMHSNEVKINVPGAYAFVGTKHVYFVSPKAIIEAMDFLKQDKLVPAKMTRAQVLNKLIEHKAAAGIDESNPTHTSSQIDIFLPTTSESKSDWKATLHLAAIRRELLDPDKVLPEFAGVLTLKDSKGVVFDGINKERIDEKLDSTEVNSNVKNEIPPSSKINETPQYNETTKVPISSKIENESIQSIVANELGVKPESVSPKKIDQKSIRNWDNDDVIEPEMSEGHDESYERYDGNDTYQNNMVEQVETPPLSNKIAKLSSKKTENSVSKNESSSKMSLSSLLAKKDVALEKEIASDMSPVELEGEEGTGRHFWYWLLQESANKNFELNKPKAPVHVTINHTSAQAFLVSPQIFLNYCKAHNLSNENQEINKVQTSFFKLKLCESKYGQNIIRASVSNHSKRSRGSRVYGLLLTVDATKELFDEQFKDLRANPHLTV
ncbi:hypothetical protein A1QO_00820 [Vibrio genomosp. F10 str. ZF-129]|uniref:HD/PDEase domain-containing protein n=1 Tax=Vibrio genomosp. F10 str. ZF-129 TaxID=1187848 RepID=A0A1E5BHD2_9VIBR|nr:TraI domain-containing protein [Vibrio genomosp. F10]OEE35335.1 hypothetical protein A1QO_00820 [Vibrio genomosp. F10 str. ZF-129]